MTDSDWQPGDGVPPITSPEGRRRQREAGVPLDEWSSMDGPDAARYRAEFRRKLDHHKRIGVILLILAVLGFIALEVLDGPTPSGDEPHIEQEETPFSPAAP